MDPSLVLEQTIHDVSNLQAEFQHMLEEIRGADTNSVDHRKKYTQKDLQIQKFIKQHGSTAENPNEDQLVKEVREEIKCLEELQQEKCTLANTALFLVARHVSKLEKNMAILEEDGVLPPLEEEIDSGTELSRESSIVSISGERRKRAISTATSTTPYTKKRKQSRSTSLQRQTDLPRQRSETPDFGTMETRPLKVRTNGPGMKSENGSSVTIDNEDEDKTLYCFCQRVSFGEMVACDGQNCKFEWFHYGCVNLKEPPKGTWYCPDCRQELAKNKLKRKRN